jgi:pyridoxine kinase
MPTILSLSSQVARGTVGHSANVFAWQRLGIEVIALPTILLSNRPDLARWAGERVRPGLLNEMLDALEANGWLSQIDAVFTGYLPSADHVLLATQLIERLKRDNSQLFYCCDPILGDDPGGLYVAEDAAAALRSELLPLADFLTPNRFELGWLTRKTILKRRDALDAAKNLPPIVLVTSAPGEADAALVNLLASQTHAWQTAVNLREAVPHGTGDLIAALFLAHLLGDWTLPNALALATAGIEAVIAASEGRDDLDLIGSQSAWVDASPWPVTVLEPG